MSRFVGRRRELVVLARALAGVREARAAGATQGRCLIVRGRRRIGKSALVEEFLRLSGVPYVFYTAQIGPGADSIEEFCYAVRQSGLPEADVFAEAMPSGIPGALRGVGFAGTVLGAALLSAGGDRSNPSAGADRANWSPDQRRTTAAEQVANTCRPLACRQVRECSDNCSCAA